MDTGNLRPAAVRPPGCAEGLALEVMEKLREQDSIRPAADVVPGHYLLVEEDTLPTWLSKGYRMTHSGVVAGARQRLVMVKEPGR